MILGRFPSLISFTLLLAVFPGLQAIAAESALRSGDLELYPTFECIGIRLAYQGDVNTNSTTAMRYREKDQSAWREALPPARIRGDRFAGSIFFLTPGRDYEVEVSLKDPDGVDRGSISGSVSTREFSFPTGKGRHWYVSPQGSDDGTGAKTRPFRTIGRAASGVRAGDVVHVLPGIYHESVSVNASGRPDSYIAFQAEGAGVILSGADPQYENYDRGNWLKRAKGSGLRRSHSGRHMWARRTPPLPLREP